MIIDFSKVYSSTTFYLYRSILGNPLGNYFASKRIIIESCGDEIMKTTGKKFPILTVF